MISYFILVHQTCRLSLAGTHHPVAILPTENGTCWEYRGKHWPQSRLHFLQGNGPMGTFKSLRASFRVKLDAISVVYTSIVRPLLGSPMQVAARLSSTFSLVQYIAMVISCAIYNLWMFIINTFAKSMGSTEIHMEYLLLSISPVGMDTSSMGT